MVGSFLLTDNNFNMKQKIKEALQQGHKNLGLSDEVFERVAASVETFITDEADIDKYVKSELVNSLLKFEQADADRKRAKREGEKKEPDNGNQPPESNPEDDKVPAWAQLLLKQNKTLAEQNKSFAEKLNAFEATRAKETAVAALNKFCNEWDYAGGFPKERDEAKRIALKLYKAGGEKMDGEQLIAAFREEFDPAVKDKGVTDFSKPFQSDGGAGGEADLDMTEVMKIYQKSGRAQGKE